MYCEHFGFKERPFTIAPNPKYLFMSELHREALAHLVFGIGDSGGFVLLTGEVGTGKTTVCRCLLEQLPEETDIAFILNPRLSALELLESICDDLELNFIQDDVSLKHLNDVLNAHLLRSHAQGRHTILLIDEAQNLDPEVLEQIRLLTNLETNETKLLQIILIGQPELKDILDRPELRQLSQRITARYHLAPLSLEDATGYIQYRMAVAGSDKAIFTETAIATIQNISQGVPRLINTICDRALLGAYAKGIRQVDVFLVKQAAMEVLGSKGKADSGNLHKSSQKSPIIYQAIAGVLLLTVGILMGSWLTGLKTSENQTNTLTKQTFSAVAFEPTNTENTVAANTQSQVKVNEPNALPYEADPTSVSPANSTQTTEDQAASSTDSPSPILALTSSYLEAFSQLSEIWGVGRLSGCYQLADIQLSCESAQGSWWELRTMDRPAIITVKIQGRSFYLNVVGMEPNRMAILKNGFIAWLDKTQIESMWAGEYLIFWKPPINFSKPIRYGDTGVSVQWLEKSLLMITQPQAAKDSIVPESIIFDREIEKQLQNFQKHYGLDADGIAGLRTIMLINQLTDATLPRLENLSNFKEVGLVTHS